MKEKKQKDTYHPYPLIALKNVSKKKEGLKAADADRMLEIPFFPSLPSSFLHWAVKT